MEKIKLGTNHKRSVSSSIRLIEKMVWEIEREINAKDEKILTVINRKISEAEVQYFQTLLGKIKTYIQYLADKYDLQVSELYLERLINSKKSSMWVILSDTASNKLRGYGEFPKEFSMEFDKDIERLKELISRI